MARSKVQHQDLASPNISDKELRELAKKLRRFYEFSYVDKKSALVFTFYKGVAYGLGIFIGGTLVVGILLWLLSSLDTIPLIGPIVKAVQRTLQ